MDYRSDRVTASRFFFEIGGLTVGATGGASLTAIAALPPLHPFRVASTDKPDLCWQLDAEVMAPTVNPSFDMSVGMGRCRLYVEADRVVCSLEDEAATQVWIEYRLDGDTVRMSSMPTHWLLFSLWLAYNMQASAYGRYALHAAAVVYDGQTSVFLGESGTGKSTHARQWMAAVDGCWLLNDDSPIVARIDDVMWVYGSPWSGKTPCFQSRHFPLRGVARLWQAPCNVARRLRPLEAIAALIPSFPPMLVHAEPFRSRMLQQVEALVSRTPVIRLDCLPNKEAAICCQKAME